MNKLGFTPEVSWCLMLSSSWAAAEHKACGAELLQRKAKELAMRKHYNVSTLNDANAVIRDYELDRFCWAAIGTARGFAGWLFCDGAGLDLEDVVQALHDYLRMCERDGTAVVDARNAEKVGYFEEILKSHARERRKATEIIRRLKFEVGAVYWDVIASLATTDDRALITEQLGADDCHLVLGCLDRIEDLAPHFESSKHLPYCPGRDALLDHCLACDIRRFDVMLETADPWDGKDEDWYFEARALLHLLHDTPVRRELDERVIGAQPKLS